MDLPPAVVAELEPADDDDSGSVAEPGSERVADVWWSVENGLPAVCCEVDAEFRSSKLGAEGCGGVLSTVDAMVVWVIVKLFSKQRTKLVLRS